MQDVSVDKASLSSSPPNDCNLEYEGNEEDDYWAVVADLVREFEQEMSNHVVVQDVCFETDNRSERSDWICAVWRTVMSSDAPSVPDRARDDIESGSLLVRREAKSENSARRCYELVRRSPCHLFIPRARPLLKPERRSSPCGQAPTLHVLHTLHA